MTLAAVLAKTTFTGFTTDFDSTLRGVITTAYNGSSIARQMFEDWIANPAHTISITNVAGVYRGFISTGRVEIDPNYLTTLTVGTTTLHNLTYITTDGTPIQHSTLDAVIHELGHALHGTRDNTSATDYAGDNVTFINTIFAQLGIPKEISYLGQAYDDIQRPGYNYTGGHTLDAAESGDKDWNSSALGVSRDLLIGGPGANRLDTGQGDDFLVGAGGNDTLNGGDGTDTADYFGPAIDYDIRKNSDGSWTVRDARGASGDGTDTLKNIEKVRFNGGEYELKAHGLGFQTDFALVIDTTGSMGSSIGSVKAQAAALIDAAFAGGAADARIGVVGFKDTTNGEPSSVILPFTDQDSFAARKAAAIAAINSITVGGGGDIPETDFDGLKLALDGHMGQWRAGAGILRIALFTDAPAKDVGLSAQVTALAHSIGATIGSASTIAGVGGSVATFNLDYGAHLAPPDDGNDNPDFPYVPADDTIAPSGPTQVQIFTIFTGPDGTDTQPLQDVADANGGQFIDANSNQDLVDALFAIISAPANSAPTALTLDHRAVAENSPAGTVVGIFTVVDPDTGDTYALSLDPSVTDFVLDGASLVVASGAHLDYEQAHTASVPVTVTDGSGATLTVNFTIDITDVADTAIPTPVSALGGYAAQIANLSRALPSSAAVQDPGSALHQLAQAEAAIAQAVAKGALTEGQADLALAHLVDATTSVAVVNYAFFTGRTPTLTGLNYLVNSPDNATDLNDPYYAKFDLTNRYINFAVNLGTAGGAGAAAFGAAYAGLTLQQAAAKAYLSIFGALIDDAKIAAILDAPVADGLGGTETRAQYLASYGGDGLSGIGTKAALVGFLLEESVRTGSGVYGTAEINYLHALAHGAVPALDTEFALTYGLPTAVGVSPVLDHTLT